MLPKFILFALLIQYGYCGKDIDGSCMIGGMHVPGCNEEPSDEIKAEMEKEKVEIQKEEEEKERNMTDEEKEDKKKTEYKKLFFTNNYDWEIREELDAADDLIHNKTDKAIEMFEDILKRYPDSPRAKYALIRSKVYWGEHLLEGENKPSEEEAKKIWEQGVEDYIELMKTFEPLSTEILEDKNDTFKSMKYKCPPAIFSQCMMHATDLCDKNAMFRKAVEVLETAFKYDNNTLKNHRYHKVLQTYYMYIVDELNEVEVASFENSLNRTKTLFPKDSATEFYKGVLYKLTNRQKEGNKILRGIPLAEGSGNSEFTHDLTDIGYVLVRNGKKNVADLLFTEASRQHLFLTPHQRPLLFLDDIETKAVWPSDINGDLDDELTPYKKGFSELINNWEAIRDEAVEVGKNITANLNWKRHPYNPANPRSLVIEPKENTLYATKDGVEMKAWNVFPLYMWGKKKNSACSSAPTACSLLKAHFQDATKCTSCTVKFIKLDPKVSILPLCSPTNDKLRIYLGLSNSDKLKYIIEGGSPKSGEEVPMVDGKLRVVDESHGHSLINTSQDEPIYLLGIDFYHPNLPVKWLEGETKKEGVTIAEHALNRFIFH